MHGEKEGLSCKRLSIPQLDDFREKDFWVSGQKTLKKWSNLKKINKLLTTSPHVVREDFKKNSPHWSKNKLDWNFKWDWFLWSVETKKLAFQQQTLKMGLVHTGIKSTHVYNEIYCCIFNVVGLYFCWRPWTYCSDTWHHGFNQIPTDKKSTNDWLYAMFGSSNLTIFQTQTSKTTQK